MQYHVESLAYDGESWAKEDDDDDDQLIDTSDIMISGTISLAMAGGSSSGDDITKTNTNTNTKKGVPEKRTTARCTSMREDNGSAFIHAHFRSLGAKSIPTSKNPVNNDEDTENDLLITL